MILLPVDVEFDVYFYTGNGLYQCYARVVDRYKNEAADVVLLELTSNLRKHQNGKAGQVSDALTSFPQCGGGGYQRRRYALCVKAHL